MDEREDPPWPAGHGGNPGVSRVGLPVPGPRARRWITAGCWVLVALLFFGFLPLAVWTGGLTRSGFWTMVVVVAAVALVVWAAVVRPARKMGLASPALQVAERVERPVPVPGVVVGPVTACMRCGSRDLATPGMRDGVWLGGGELQFLVCRNCNSRAPPLEFERGEDYVAFVKELNEGSGEAAGGPVV